MKLELDFTGLNNIAPDRPREGLESHKQEDRYSTLEFIEKQLYGPQGGPQGQPIEIEETARIRLNREKEDHNRTVEICRRYQDNVKKSSQLQTEILKGAKAGESPCRLFLKACEAISLMTGNKLFYSQIEAYLKSVYGEALLEPDPLQWELDSIAERVDRMEAALNRSWAEAEDKERIRKAIEAHNQRKEEVERLLQ